MTTEHLIKDALDTWSQEARTSENMADTAIARGLRRRRTRRVASAVAIAGLAVAVGVPIMSLRQAPTTVAQAGSGSGNHSVTGVDSRWTPLPLSHPHAGLNSVVAHTLESPPVHMIAAGRLAVSAYQIKSKWYLLNTTTGKYQKTSWSFLNVSPGLGLAAAVTGKYGSKNVSIVDMSTLSVIRTITLSQPVATLNWSPDGKTLAASVVSVGSRGPYRSGFYLIDMTSGSETLTTMAQPSDMDNFWNWGVRWTFNGDYLFAYDAAADSTNNFSLFFDPHGKAIAAPAHAESLAAVGAAGISPDGRLSDYPAGASDGSGSTAYSGPTVYKLATGDVAGHQPIENLQGWASNNSLIGEGCDASCANEFHSRLVLVSLDGKSITPLSGSMTGSNDGGSGQWSPLLTVR